MSAFALAQDFLQAHQFIKRACRYSFFDHSYIARTCALLPLARNCSITWVVGTTVGLGCGLPPPVLRILLRLRLLEQPHNPACNVCTHPFRLLPFGTYCRLCNHTCIHTYVHTYTLPRCVQPLLWKILGGVLGGLLLFALLPCLLARCIFTTGTGIFSSTDMPLLRMLCREGYLNADQNRCRPVHNDCSGGIDCGRSSTSDRGCSAALDHGAEAPGDCDGSD